MRLGLCRYCCQDWWQAVLMGGNHGTSEERGSAKFPGLFGRGTAIEAARH